MTAVFHRVAVTALRSKQSLYQLSYRTSFFSKKKTSAIEEGVSLPDVLSDRRPHASGKDLPTMKDNLNLLKTEGRLHNKKGYKPPTDVESRIKSLVTDIVPEMAENWKDLSLADSSLKYKVLTKCMDTFDHNIPNLELSQIKTVGDAVDFFLTERRVTSKFEDLATLDLPENLSIQMDYLRFDPKTDSMFGGRTAYPGRDTVVTSIKFKRKYQDIRTRKEKPGYVDHYYGY